MKKDLKQRKCLITFQKFGIEPFGFCDEDCGQFHLRPNNRFLFFKLDNFINDVL